jgi:hypothetical protein
MLAAAASQGCPSVPHNTGIEGIPIVWTMSCISRILRDRLFVGQFKVLHRR